MDFQMKAQCGTARSSREKESQPGTGTELEGSFDTRRVEREGATHRAGSRLPVPNLSDPCSLWTSSTFPGISMISGPVVEPGGLYQACKCF